jgi:hypothetical protein
VGVGTGVGLGVGVGIGVGGGVGTGVGLGVGVGIGVGGGVEVGVGVGIGVGVGEGVGVGVGVGVGTGMHVISMVFCPGNTSAVTPPLQHRSPFSSVPSIMKFLSFPTGTRTVISSPIPNVAKIGSKLSVIVRVKSTTQSRMDCSVATPLLAERSKHCAVGNPIITFVAVSRELPLISPSRQEVWINSESVNKLTIIV